MTPKAGLERIGRIVASELARGELSEGTHALGEILAEAPQSVVLLLDLIAAERAKKRPKSGLTAAYAFMISQALEFLRQRSEAGQRYADEAIDLLRERLATLIAAGKLPPSEVMHIASAFMEAKLDVGVAVRAEVAARMGDTRDEDEDVPVSPQDPGEMFADIARMFGDDPFQIHNQLSMVLAAMPTDQRSVLAGALATAEQPSLRASAIGWLLDAEEAVRRSVAGVLAETARRGLVAKASLARLLVIRSWFGDDERALVDAIVRQATGKTTDEARQPAAQIKTLVMTGRDGAGAQSLFGVLKIGRKHAIASILVKQGFGIRDAFVQVGLSRDEAAELLMRIDSEMPSCETSLESAAKLIGHALAENREIGVPPPFGLVQCIELLGLTGVSPQRYPADALVADLLADIDQTPAAVTRALRSSAGWHRDQDFADSWFENDDETGDLIASERGKARQTDAVLARRLPDRRGFWGEVLAWTAFAMHEDDTDDSWVALALVAREWLGSRPLAEIPLAKAIASQSVEAFG